MRIRKKLGRNFLPLQTHTNSKGFWVKQGTIGDSFQILANCETTDRIIEKEYPFCLEPKNRCSFITLKDLLSSEQLLQYADFTKPFVLTTDASNETLGAIHSQGPIGRDLQIAYTIKTLIIAERN